MGEPERPADSEGDVETVEGGVSPSDSNESPSDSNESPLDSNESPSDPADNDPPSLGSRILVTWAGLTAVGVVGGLLSSAVQGPVGFVIYLAVTLASVGVLLYNVNELVKGWVDAGQTGSFAD